MQLPLATLLASLSAFLPKLLWALVIFGVGWYVIKLAQRLVKKALERSKIDPILHTFVLTVTRMLMLVLLSISALSTLGVDTTSLVTSLGAVGLAVSLAVKDSLTNMAGGVVVLLIKPFALGDYVEIGGTAGTVTEIGIFHTVLKTGDNKCIFLPNGDVAKAKVVNFSRESLRRLDMIFSIGYEDDFEKARGVLLDVISKAPNALQDPSPFVRMGEQAASSINITCRVWVENAHYWELFYHMNEAVKLAFDEAGINIPYNQLDVHLVQN